MSENKENRSVSNEEIDLLDLFNRMGRTINRWCVAAGKAFLISIVFIFRRWLPLGLSVLLGLGISYLFRTSPVSLYTSNMVLKGNSVTSPEMFQYINRLHTYFSENNSTALSEALSIDPETVNNIIDINSQWIIDQNRDSIPDFVDYNKIQNANDTVNLKLRMQDQLNVRLQIKSPMELSKIREGIITFFEKDSLFQQRNRLRLRQNKELIARLDYDILQLDSLQKIKYFEETRENQPKAGGQMVFLQEQNTQLVYGDIYSLYKTKQLIESEQVLNNKIITILSDFSVPVGSYNGIINSGKQIVPICFCLTIFILILLANKKKLEEIFKKYR
jgi:hypothetical protein